MSRLRSGQHLNIKTFSHLNFSLKPSTRDSATSSYHIQPLHPARTPIMEAEAIGNRTPRKKPAPNEEHP